MEQYRLKINLLSDTCFSRGDGKAGYVDQEIKYDRYGMPYIDGRTIKGLTASSCAEVLNAIQKSSLGQYEKLYNCAVVLFGLPGSGTEKGKLRFGRASLPDDLRIAIQKEFAQKTAGLHGQQKNLIHQELKRSYLEAFTITRCMTAMDETGAPLDESLRTVRLIRKNIFFITTIESDQNLEDFEKGLLAACISVLNRVGSNRNRGNGKISAEIQDAQGEILKDRFLNSFFAEVKA